MLANTAQNDYIHSMPSAALIHRLRVLCAQAPHLAFLVLYGSRARNDAHPKSDWDFGYCASGAFDAATFMTQLVALLDTEAVDLVDLANTSGLLRFRAAQDGVLVFEQKPGLFDAFCVTAARFWFDAQPVLTQAYERVLQGVSRGRS